MNTLELQNKLMSAARSTAPSDHVPYAFEKRIMARIAAIRPLDAWTLWGHALWRAAAPCLAITLLTGTWMLWSGQSNSRTDFSEEFETALLAVTDPSDPADEIW